jgi:hypothetical protein
MIKLTEILCGHDPNVRMMAENKQTLFSREHYATGYKGCVFTSEWVLFFKIDELAPQFDLENRNIF